MAIDTIKAELKKQVWAFWVLLQSIDVQLTLNLSTILILKAEFKIEFAAQASRGKMQFSSSKILG